MTQSQNAQADNGGLEWPATLAKIEDDARIAAPKLGNLYKLRHKILKGRLWYYGTAITLAAYLGLLNCFQRFTGITAGYVKNLPCPC